MNKDIYCIDTSFFIECWNHYYRNDFFKEKNFFQGLLDKAERHQIYIHQQVILELKPREDDLTKWINKNKKQFYKIETEQEEKIVNLSTRVHEKYKDRIKSKNPDFADPFVIASAKILNGMVVSNEKTRKGQTRIPDICSDENIEHLSIFDFIEKIGIKFTCID